MTSLSLLADRTLFHVFAFSMPCVYEKFCNLPHGRYFTGYWVQANQLQELGVRIIDNEKCEKFIPPIYITPNRVCFKTSGGVCKVM